MNPSLAVIVPVHNVQAILVNHVSDILEVMPDLSLQFEILIVDDASTDDTEEVAHDLTRRFPQVRLVRHSRRRGTAAAVKTGYEHTMAELIVVQNERDQPDTALTENAAGARREVPRVLPRPDVRQFDPDAIERLVDWSSNLKSIPPAITS